MIAMGQVRRAPAGADWTGLPLLAVLGAVLMAIGSVCRWADVLTGNEMDTDIYPVIRGVMIAASIGYLGIAVAMTVRGPLRAAVAIVLGLGSLGALLGCLAFIAIGQVGYYHSSSDVDVPGSSGICDDAPYTCIEPDHTLYDPAIGILLIVIGSLVTGGVALWVLCSWARWLYQRQIRTLGPAEGTPGQ